jgi:hypothetical protein
MYQYKVISIIPIYFLLFGGVGSLAATNGQTGNAVYGSKFQMVINYYIVIYIYIFFI